eukprot:110897-Pelagomonas_calceolata.AAC.3
MSGAAAAAAFIDARLLGCFSSDAPCHDGLKLSKLFSAGAFRWGASAAGAICPSCMGQAHRCSVSGKSGGKGPQCSWPSDHLQDTMNIGFPALKILSRSFCIRGFGEGVLRLVNSWHALALQLKQSLLLSKPVQRPWHSILSRFTACTELQCDRRTRHWAERGNLFCALAGI